MNRRSFWAALTLAVAVLCVVSATSFSHEPVPKRSERSALAKELDLFLDVMAYIRSDYVDEVPVKKLVQGALSGMLKSLDPYSQFLTADAYKDLKVDTKGEFVGIGIEVSTKGGMLHVISALDGSPAELAGVRAGDAIIKINGEPTRDEALDSAVAKLRGEPGSVVRLTLMRENENQLLELDIPRAMIKVKSIKEAKILDDGIGYVKLSAFQEKSVIDLGSALAELEGKGFHGLILDLRNNAGGLLHSAVEIAEIFVPEGKLIVSTKGRTAARSQQYLSKNRRPKKIEPLVVLVNKGSASGSEILAGALQDHGLATVVGVKTFGKGSIQTLVPLADGTAVRMTTSKYYTPKGRVIHEVGITPDLIVEDADPKDGKDEQLDKAVALIRSAQPV